MATNFYFQSGIPGGRSSEQLLMEDIIIECLKIYGFDVYYIPRTSVNEDLVLNEDPLQKYDNAFPLEMYMSNVTGFEGEGDLLSKFGVEIRDTATFIVSRRRWDEIVAKSGAAQITPRPAEGDVLYFPLTSSFFEIKRVETRDPFFQVGKLYVFKLECELMQFSSERFDTNISEINDAAAEESLSITDYELLMEDSSKFLIEAESNIPVILESYLINEIDSTAQNETFDDESDILDFSETNPFGEIL
ncbi:MAG: hypothetical protein ACO3UU_07060 [Minisyncoccia bacterium]